MNAKYYSQCLVHNCCRKDGRKGWKNITRKTGKKERKREEGKKEGREGGMKGGRDGERRERYTPQFSFI